MYIIEKPCCLSREKAFKLLKKALNINSRIAVFHLGLASGYAKLNNKALARKEFLKGLQLLFSGW